MINYETLYFTLATQVDTAIDHLNGQNFGLAQDSLIIARQRCESLRKEMEDSAISAVPHAEF